MTVSELIEDPQLWKKKKKKKRNNKRRPPPEHPRYRLMREVGAALGRAGYAVITGGGSGLMEAANRGASEVGAPSIGCNVEIPREQQLNVT
jgi:predicted Rossmann-fold nucleotide-binding protein